MSNRFHPRQHFHQHPRNHKKDKVWFGLIVVLIGVFIMLKKMHMIPYFDKETMLALGAITLGLLIGIKKRFQNNAWWIFILLGIAYLIPEFEVMGTSSSSLVLPAALIIGGALIIVRSGKKKDCTNSIEVVTNHENMLNLDVTFGGRKEIITSKEFKGGHISATFAGAEINMVQADNKTQPIVIDLKVSFSGIELIVPSHWEIQNDISPTFGGVEDHRSIHTPTPANEEKRVLILRGTCNFASVEIKSY
jgi:hypothetical protein